MDRWEVCFVDQLMAIWLAERREKGALVLDAKITISF